MKGNPEPLKKSKSNFGERYKNTFYMDFLVVKGVLSSP